MEISAPNRTVREPAPSVLDRGFDLGAVSWMTIGWAVVALAAVAIRFANLDVWALTPEEAWRAFHGFALYRGLGDELPETAPLFQLLEAFAFFLFGVTDAIARIMPALLGLAIVLLPLGLQPFVGRPAALGMAAAAALSPTLVYASRTADPAIAVAAAAFLFVVAFLRIGHAATDTSSRAWAAVSGIALAALLASGPASLSVLVAIGVGAAVAVPIDRGPDRPGAIGRSLARLGSGRQALVALIVAFAITLAALFTRLFSDLGAIAGLGELVAEWLRLLATRSSATPPQFFLLAILLYEILPLVFALVAAYRGRTDAAGGLGWPFFAGWFGTALLLFSFSSGRAPEHAALVVLPLVLLGGATLGDLVSALVRRGALTGRGGLLALVFLGSLVGLIAAAILAGRVGAAPEPGPAIAQVVAVVTLVLVPLGVVAYHLVRAERAEGRVGEPVRLALLVVAVVLGAYTLRSAVMLNFYNADEGTELLAQRTPTEAVRPLVGRMLRLSRDATVAQGSVRDVTGSFGLDLALDERVEWPFRWYFREFPDLRVVEPELLAETGAEAVIAADDGRLEEAGYTIRQYPALNRVPGVYTAPPVGDLLADLVLPSRWDDGADYLLYRSLETAAVPETVTLALDADLTARVLPNTGPFNLLDQAATGAARGQFNQPRDIAVAPDTGMVYVVDMANARIQRFDADNAFVGAWGSGATGAGIAFGTTESGLGPTGLDIGPDGLISVADTWNHRIVILDATGTLVREFGAFGDIADDPAAVDTQTGLFFGPRDVLVTEDEIYVVDTGNERVQVFAKDGTFKRAWGGFGTDPGQFVEPVGIALGPDDRIYVADSGNARISVFSRAGEPLAQWPVPAWRGHQYFEPYLAFGPDGNLYATSAETGSVEVFSPEGDLIRSIREVEGDVLQRPVGIAAAPDGAILITDAGRNAVLRYEPPGSEEELPSAASPVSRQANG